MGDLNISIRDPRALSLMGGFAAVTSFFMPTISVTAAFFSITVGLNPSSFASGVSMLATLMVGAAVASSFIAPLLPWRRLLVIAGAIGACLPGLVVFFNMQNQLSQTNQMTRGVVGAGVQTAGSVGLSWGAGVLLFGVALLLLSLRSRALRPTNTIKSH